MKIIWKFDMSWKNSLALEGTKGSPFTSHVECHLAQNTAMKSDKLNKSNLLSRQ